LIGSISFENITITEINNSESTIEKQQIVTFQTGGDMVRSEKPSIKYDMCLTTDGVEEREHTIIDFLGRPVVVASGVWSTTDPAQTIIKNILFPSAIWTQPMWSEKLRGFRFLRATLNFQVQVNASPFDVGRLIVFWSPFDEERNNYRPFLSRTNWTGYPGVELDVGNMMTSELRIPYVSMFSHLDQTRNLQPYGALRLGVISSYDSVNETSVDYTVYCWMTDVQLSVATPYFAQMEGDHRSKLGVISGGAKIVGDAARLFGNAPGIKAVAKPVAWLSDVVKGAASSLGFSKPIDSQAVMTMANVPAKNYTNADGLDNSVVLGATHTNEVEHNVNLFGTDVDEMNISYVVSKPNWIQGFNWAFSVNPKDQALFKIPVHAGICGTDTVPGFTGEAYSGTHMSMVASAFRFWRGGISFRFSAVKNQYYSGRLVLAYYPGVMPDQIINYSTFDINKVQKWIWDIKRDSDLEIEVPYNSNTNFMRVRMHNNTDPTSVSSITNDTATGTLAVFVDNRLRGPATVRDNIWIQVWVKGMSDMSFAIPDMVRFAPVATMPPTSLLPSGPEFSKKFKPKSEGYYAQMIKAEDTFDINKNDAGTARDESTSALVFKNPDVSLCPSKFSVGEMVTNLRLLTRRFSLCYAATFPAGTFSFTLDPAFLGIVTAAHTPLTYFARMYAFYHGGRRYKIAVQDQNFLSTINGRVYVASSEVISTSPRTYSTVPGITNFFGRFVHTQFSTLNPFVEITTPYYANVPIQLVSNDYTVPNHLRLIYGATIHAPVDAAVNLFTAATDDFSYGYLIGAPMIIPTGQL
jgi:hypothetical protein